MKRLAAAVTAGGAAEWALAYYGGPLWLPLGNLAAVTLFAAGVITSEVIRARRARRRHGTRSAGTVRRVTITRNGPGRF